MDSFAVSSKIQRSKQLAKIYKLNGVPSIVVDGKYVTNGTMSGGMDDMTKVMQQLADRELAAKAVPASNATPVKAE